MRIYRIGMIKERLHLCKLTSYLPDIRRISCGISSQNDRIHSEEVSVYTAIWYNQRTHTCANINQFIRYARISGQRHNVLALKDHMGQVTELWLSCYLVLPTIDSKTR